MRAARAIIGLALIVIGIFAIADAENGGNAWWLVAGLAAAAGIAGLLSATRPAPAANDAALDL